MGKLSVIIGTQWGDEGKGKWVDKIAHDIDIVCRFQGGNNAGHTVHVGGKKHVFHLLPNGVLHEGKIIALTSGVVIDPRVLMREIKNLREHVSVTPERLWISTLAHVITPWHVYLDTKSEESAKNPIGTTKRGIGPTYAERDLRNGMRVETMARPEKRKEWLSKRKEADPEFKTFYDQNPALWKEFEVSAAFIADYICPAEEKIRKGLKEGQNVLCEGAQGTMLDINHGTYPFVTSSSTLASQAAVSLGIDPRKIDRILGVGKVYATRVGEGPFPTEIHDQLGQVLRERGNEYGATTKRPRRCGWFDAIAMRFANEVNGLDGVYLNKLDILSGLETIKVAVAYKHPTLGVLNEYPSSSEVLKECKPVYETFKAWQQDIPRQGSFSKLPGAARDFLLKLEEFSRCRILSVGTGVDREDFLTP
ncbi:MAG: adenylosuccinate synthase [Deltaproteobacteria bacterium]|nr:adenylosuccinate synthase [Deltaproteobacteria bacterium]